MTRTIHSLDGDWHFTLDNGQSGTLAIPSSWDEAGYGDPFQATALGSWRKKHHLEGIGTYTRTVTLPDASTVWLELDGVHWRSEVWLDGTFIGGRESLSTTHPFDLSPLRPPGTAQTLTIKVHNLMIYALPETHIHSPQTATMWGGITGGARLVANNGPMLRDVQVLPSIHPPRLRVATTTPEGYALKLHLTDPDNGTVRCSLSA